MEWFWIFLSGVISVLLFTSIVILCVMYSYLLREEKQKGG